MSNNDKKSDKKYLKIILTILCGMIGIFLILGGELFVSDNNAAENADSTSDFPSAKEYAKEMEDKLIQVCSQVRGVGRVSAVVTLSGGYNAVYAQDSQSSGSGYKNEFVMVGNGSSEKPLLIGYTHPAIAGIGIICSGGGDEYVRCEVISLVSAAFAVSPNKIYVAPSQN